MRNEEMRTAFELLLGARLLEARRSQWHVRFLLERPGRSALGCPALWYLSGALVNCGDLVYRPAAGERLLAPERLAELEPRLEAVGGAGPTLELACTARDGSPGTLSLRARGLLLYDAAGEELTLDGLRATARDCWGRGTEDDG